MTNTNVPIETVIERINRFPTKGEPVWNREEIVEWIGEALHAINAEGSSEETSDILIIEDGTTVLPHHNEIIEILEHDLYYHMEDVGPTGILRDSLTYKINSGRLHTSFQEGKVLIRYTRFPVDDRGYPLIPDTESFLKAIEAYGLERIGRKLYMLGDMGSTKYQLLSTEKGYYMEKAKTDALTMSSDRLANFAKVVYNPYVDLRRKTPKKLR